MYFFKHLIQSHVYNSKEEKSNRLVMAMTLQFTHKFNYYCL